MKLFLLLSLAALPLGAQSVRSRLDGRVPAVAVPAIDSLVQQAAAEGLPTEPLIQKALEGGAKHIAPGRIVTAVQLERAQLRDARYLLGRAGVEPPITAAELTVVASALERGLPAPLVERLVGALPREPRGPALHAVADLVAHGFDEDSAVDLVIDAAHQGLRGVRLLDVAYAAAQELQRGHTRPEALARVRRELPNVPSPPTPAPAAVVRARRPSRTAATPSRP